MLSRTSVKKPFLVVVMIIIILILGVISYTQMSVDFLPNMNFPFLVVVTVSPGLSPQEVEAQITYPIEDSMRSLSNVSTMTSLSIEHGSAIILQYKSSANMDAARLDIQAALQTVSSSMPSGTLDSIVMSVNPNMLPIMTIAVSEKGIPIEDSTETLTELYDQLRSVDGISTVDANGLVEDIVLVMMSSEKLAQHVQAHMPADETQTDENYVSPVAEQIAGVLGSVLNSATVGVSVFAQNIELPAGYMQGQNGSFVVKVGDKINSYEELAGLPLFSVDMASIFERYAFVFRALETVQVSQGLLDFMKEANDPDGRYQGTIGTLRGALDAFTGEDGVLEFVEDDPERPAGYYRVNVGLLDDLDALATMMSGFYIAEEDVNGLNENIPAMADLKQYILDNFVLLPAGTDGNGEPLPARYVPAFMQNGTFLALAQSAITELRGMQIDAGNIDRAYELLDALLAFAPDVAAAGTALEAFLVNNEWFEPVYSESNPDAVLRYVVNTDFIDAVSNMSEMLIRLEDTAAVHQLNTAGKVHNLVNGAAGVMLSINKQPEVSTVDAANGVKALLAAAQAENPNLEYLILYDQGESVMMMIRSIVVNLLVGAILAMVILFIFLRDIKPTLIVSMSMLVSVVGAFVLMYFFDIDLNILSLSGLCLGVGMLVDNSIVVLENIYKLRAEGKSIYQACVQGAKQMTAPITASTITTVIVFVPLIFLEGITQQIVMDIALTLTFSLIASLIVALTFVPMASSRMLVKPAKDEGKTFRKIKNAYAKSLEGALKHKWIVLIVVVAFFGGSVFAFVGMDQIFFPTTDAAYFSMSVSLDGNKFPEDKTYDETVEEVIAFLYQKAASFDYVQTVGVELSQGFGLGGISIGGGGITAYVKLDSKAKISSADAAKAMMAACTPLPGFSEDAYSYSYNADSGVFGGMLEDGVLSVYVDGKNLDQMRAAAVKVGEKLAEIEGVVSVSDGVGNADEEYYILVDKEKAVRAGLVGSTGQVYLMLLAELTEPSESATVTYEDGTSLGVTVYMDNYKLIRWHKLFDENGGVYKVLLDTEGGLALEDGTPVTYHAETAKFSFTKENVQTLLHTAGDNLVTYYEVGRKEYVDLVNYVVGTNFNTGEPVPLWTILDDASFARGADGNILYRTVKTEDGAVATDPDTGEPIYELYQGEKVPEGIAMQPGYLSIMHTDGARQINVSVTYDSKYNSKTITAAMQKVVDDVQGELPDGVIVSFGGENPMIAEVYQTLFIVVGVGVLLIYLVMVAQFQSLKLPFVIMFTIPLAFTGSIIALLISGTPVSIVALVGFIVLMGVVVNNGIVFIDNVRRLINQEDMGKRDALINTAKERFRPILMTALTTIIALFGMALDSSAAGAMMQPMGIATVGGLIYSTILTLYVVPIIFDILDKGKKDKFADEDRANDEFYVPKEEPPQTPAAPAAAAPAVAVTAAPEDVSLPLVPAETEENSASLQTTDLVYNNKGADAPPAPAENQPADFMAELRKNSVLRRYKKE